MSDNKQILLLDIFDSFINWKTENIGLDIDRSGGLLGMDTARILNDPDVFVTMGLEDRDIFFEEVSWIDLSIDQSLSFRGTGLARWGEMSGASGYIPEVVYCEYSRDLRREIDDKCLLAVGLGRKRYTLSMNWERDDPKYSEAGAVDSFGWTPFMRALVQDDPDLLTWQEYADGVMKPILAKAITPLSLAVIFNNPTITERLLRHGADPNERGLSHPLLSIAVMLGHVDVVRLLLQYKADLCLLDGDGQDALDTAEFAICHMAKRANRRYDLIIDMINDAYRMKSFERSIQE